MSVIYIIILLYTSGSCLYTKVNPIYQSNIHACIERAKYINVMEQI